MCRLRSASAQSDGPAPHGVASEEYERVVDRLHGCPERVGRRIDCAENQEAQGGVVLDQVLELEDREVRIVQGVKELDARHMLRRNRPRPFEHGLAEKEPLKQVVATDDGFLKPSGRLDALGDDHGALAGAQRREPDRRSTRGLKVDLEEVGERDQLEPSSR